MADAGDGVSKGVGKGGGQGDGGKGGGGEGVECVICQEAFAGDQQPCHTLEECGHKFHTTCLIAWFRRGNNGLCPLCRAGPQVPAEPVEAESDAAEARADVLNAAVNRYIDRGIDATDTLQEVRAGMRTFDADQDIGQEIRALTLTNPAVARLWTQFLLTYNGIVDAEESLNDEADDEETEEEVEEADENEETDEDDDPDLSCVLCGRVGGGGNFYNMAPVGNFEHGRRIVCAECQQNHPRGDGEVESFF